MTETLTQLFLRDLEKLKTEISSFKDEKNLWKISGDTHLDGGQVKNSAGNLCLHLCGNLQHFVGAVLGNSEYIRNRDAEFSRKNVPQTELIKEIDEAIKIVNQTLESLSESDLNNIYPSNIFGEGTTTAGFLIHLAAHLNYHLGQINYHRRLIDK
ncbi:MAG: DUF1572 family protein [Ignavibacteriaceae bacterium]|nr:DUF1572 family protein [Ignavibacteriaceae bacterium]